MQSPDWPDLPFVQARAFGTGRDGWPPTISVIHYTAGSERSTSAEDGAAYDQRRTDGTSTHFFHDSNSTVQCVLLKDRANACLYHGNRLGIQHELCGTQQTRAQWLDPASDATITRAAYQVARDHKRLGIPLRRLTPAQVRACWYDYAPGGICGHADVTRAFPEDGGDHMDPGAEFPWDLFMQRATAFYAGATPTTTQEARMYRVQVQGQSAVYLTNGADRTHLDGNVNARLEAAGVPLVVVANGNNGFQPAESYLDQVTRFARPQVLDQQALVNAVTVAVGALNVELSDEDLVAITTAVVARPDNPLGDADKPAIAAALRDVLRSV